MKPFELLDSMGNIRDKFILEAEDMEKLKKTRAHHRSPGLTILVAALTVSLLALTAFASANFLGIRDMTDNTFNELPSEADEYIQTQEAQTTNGDISCTVVESLFEQSYFMVSIGVSCGDEYVLIPEDMGPTDCVDVIGLEGDETLEEYASRQGKKLLNVSGDLGDRDELGIGVESLDFERQSDSDATLLIYGQKTATAETKEAVCTIVVKEANSDNVQRIIIPISVSQAPTEGERVFVADNPNVIPGMTIRSVTITDTAVGMTVTFDADVDSQESIPWMKAEEITGYEGGWMLNSTTDKWECTWSRVEGNITDTLTLNFYDDDGNVAGTIIFKLSEE